MAVVTCAVMSPSMTISTGEPSPPENSRFMMMNACFESTSSGRVLTPEKPSLMPRYGTAAITKMPTASIMLTTGRRMTRPLTRSQKCRFRSPEVLRRPRSRSESILSPVIANTAGRRVSEAAAAMTTTRIAPRPMLR